VSVTAAAHTRTDRFETTVQAMLGADLSRPEYTYLVRYFREIVCFYGLPRRPTTVLVTHVLPERPVFISALAATTDLASLIPKPRSIHELTLDRVSGTVPVHRLSRSECGDPERLLSHLEACAARRPVVLVDIGGYFANALPEIAVRFSGKLLGVVEDTENGLQRYQRIDHPPCPIYSVARSPLKQPEDHLVGQSVVFSVEALLRSRGDILQGRPSLVVGFGKVGQSVASFLRGRGVRVAVYDKSPTKRTQALSYGFDVYDSMAEALRDSLLVIGATGNRSLRERDLPCIRSGAYVATVTSSDDELEMAALGRYQRAQADAHVVRYQHDDQHFFLLNDGNAVNFIHDAVVGPFIHLVQGEILVAIWSLQHHTDTPGIFEVSPIHRERLARLWMSCFGTRQVEDGGIRGVAT
jgi:adenosylhomocysteinase